MFIYIYIYIRFNEDDPEFFSAEVRTLVIDFILNRVSWGKDQGDVNCVGIQCLLDEGVYRAAYPLHDVSCSIYQSKVSIFNLVRIGENNIDTVFKSDY